MILSRRRMLRLGAAAGLVPMTRWAGLGAATPSPGARFDVTPYVDPELRPIVPQLLRFTSTVPTTATLATYRRQSDAYTLPLLPTPAVREQRVPGVAGQPDVLTYVINDRAAGAPRPAILHTHGGGFISGSARADRRHLQEIAQALDCVIVSVEYRLAPETRWSGSLEDNYAALRWLYRHAAELGADPSRIAVMGESAGGGHAALLAIAARDRGEVPIVFQALIYPMLDDRTGSTRRKPPFMGAVIWDETKNRFGWESFLGVPAGSARVPAAAVPARLADLRRLPPAFIGVGSIDLFVDEDIDYARRLVDAGVATQLEVVPGAFHGFDNMPGARIATRFRETLLAALRGAFAVAVAK